MISKKHEPFALVKLTELVSINEEKRKGLWDIEVFLKQKFLGKTNANYG